MTTQTRYIVTPAPGHYGHRTAVISSHRTLDAAKRAAGTGCAIYEGDETKGHEWLAVYAQMRPNLA